jgi:hypothetical protein
MLIAGAGPDEDLAEDGAARPVVAASKESLEPRERETGEGEERFLFLFSLKAKRRGIGDMAATSVYFSGNPVLPIGVVS